MDEVRFTLWVTGDDPEDVDAIYDASRSLRSELAEISEIQVSDAMTDEARPGTRSGLMTQLLAEGALPLAVAYYGGKPLLAIVKVVQGWIERNKGKRVTVKMDENSTSIDLVGYPSDEAAVILGKAIAQKKQGAVADRKTTNEE